jgi:hypothetical protein
VGSQGRKGKMKSIVVVHNSHVDDV